MKKIVAQIGFSFNSLNELEERTIKLKAGSEILSVSSTQKNNENVIWFHYMYPSDSMNWREYHFIICEYNYIEIEINEHNYIGNIYINDKTYAVFCAKKATI